jgi:insertion element IS1 protein InsB
MAIRLESFCEAEMDEQWSYVGKKSKQRGIWHAIDHVTSTVLAYVFGKRKDEVFKQLKALLQPYNIARYYTDDWGAYERYFDAGKHEVGKAEYPEDRTQKLESADVDKALKRKNYLLLEVSRDARHRHRIAD